LALKGLSLLCTLTAMTTSWHRCVKCCITPWQAGLVASGCVYWLGNSRHNNSCTSWIRDVWQTHMLKLGHVGQDQNCTFWSSSVLPCGFVPIWTVSCHTSKHLQFTSDMPCKFATSIRFFRTWIVTVPQLQCHYVLEMCAFCHLVQRCYSIWIEYQAKTHFFYADCDALGAGRWIQVPSLV